jgi:hypothetical protein
MSAFAKLKLVSAQAERKSPMILRRNKLTGHIDHQIASAKAEIEGGIYTVQRVKLVKDAETGERKPVQTAARIKQWWWKSPNGKIMLALRYGSKPIEIAKGKNAVEVGSMSELVAALDALKEGVLAGELDAQIEQASGSLRAGFAKKK